MNFLERFKGKTSIMDKEGIDGIVKMKALPIEKDLHFDGEDSSRLFLQRMHTDLMLPTSSKQLNEQI